MNNNVTVPSLNPHHPAVAHNVHALAIGAIIVCVIITAALALQAIAFKVIARVRKKGDIEASPFLRIVANRMRRSALAVTVVGALGISMPFLPVEYSTLLILRNVFAIVFFLVLGWFMVSSVYLFEDTLLMRYDLKASDNLKARRVRTQLQLMRRLLISLLMVVDAGLILSLYQNSRIWHYGAGLLASAGLASLVLATAAKSTASNLLAGLQIALTEPIRLDDVVIVEGEWGKIEEITTTYVIVAIWDYRRLVLPLTYFIENPFQNWTREHSDLMGTAFLYVDYSIPVEALREEFFRMLEESPLWDRKIKALQVTNLSERTMEIRCLLSCRNASEQFDLRCIIREGMIAFIQKNYPDAFPRTRFSAVGEMPMAGAPGSLPQTAATQQPSFQG